MIIEWLVQMWFELLRLIVPRPAKMIDKKVDLDTPCPSCGHGPMSIETVTVSTNPGKPGSMRRTQIQWTCTLCKAWAFSNPIKGDNANIIHGREIIGL